MSQTTERIHELVEKLNRYRHEYYNEDAPAYPMQSMTISMMSWRVLRKKQGSS